MNQPQLESQTFNQQPPPARNAPACECPAGDVCYDNCFMATKESTCASQVCYPMCEQDPVTCEWERNDGMCPDGILDPAFEKCDLGATGACDTMPGANGNCTIDCECEVAVCCQWGDASGHTWVTGVR
jgi:hypothetical protein